MGGSSLESSNLSLSAYLGVIMTQRFIPIYGEMGWYVWDTDLNCAYRDRGKVKFYKSEGKAQIRAAQCSEKWPSLVRHTTGNRERN